MTLESKCQMTKENKSIGLFGGFFLFVFVCLVCFFISTLQRKLQKKKNKTQAESVLETKSYSELRSMEMPSSCGCGKDGSVVPL